MGCLDVAHEGTASTAVLRRVAEATGTEPADLSPPLSDVVDPEALDRLFGPPGTDSVECVTFDYQGYRVVVSSAEEVTLRELPR